MKVLDSFIRVYTDSIEQSVSYYELLTGEKCSMRVLYREVNIELARVGVFLILGGADTDLQPFINTKATLVVDSVLEFKEHVINNGGKIIRDIKQVPTGLNLTMQNPDGSVIEYVQFDK